MWSMAKKPSHSFRLQTMSVHDLSNGMVAVRLRLNAAEIKHRRRKLKDGPLLNAVVAWYLSRGIAEQQAIAVEGLARYEAILEGELDALSPGFRPDNPAMLATGSIPAHDPGEHRMPGIGVRARQDGIDDVYRKGKDKPPKAARKPKR